jgi:hypothetical protein
VFDGWRYLVFLDVGDLGRTLLIWRVYLGSVFSLCLDNDYIFMDTVYPRSRRNQVFGWQRRRKEKG